jgi:hypothetical protein
MFTSALLKGGIALALASAVWPSTAEGQWFIAASVSADRFWGASIEAGPERRSFRPYRPTTLGLGLNRRSGAVGVGLRLQYSAASLALEGSDAVVAVKGVFTVYGLAPELSYRLAALGRGNTLRLHGGPMFELWGVQDEAARSRVGVQGGVSLDVALGGRVDASVDVGVALTSSPFKSGELAGYELRALWRRRFGFGLQYRL